MNFQLSRPQYQKPLTPTHTLAPSFNRCATDCGWILRLQDSKGTNHTDSNAPVWTPEVSDTNVVTFTRLNRRANGGQCGFQVLEYLHRPEH